MTATQLAVRGLALALALSGAACAPVEPRVEPGRWRAWLDSPGGELPFGLDLQRRDGTWSATLINGPERLQVPTVSIQGARILLDIDHFDAHVEAVLESADLMTGRWWKTGVHGAVSELPFHAARGERYRFPPLGEDPAGDVSGRWSVLFAAEEDPAVAEFSRGEGSEVTGTFRTTLGDYRYLAGSFEGRTLRLSTFDGAHAFLFHAELSPDGSLVGDFWSRESWHDSWTAVRDGTAELDDATAQVAWIEGASLSDVAYPDLDGNLRSLDDPAFAGKARILEVFGSWCPNCNDATAYLLELRERYGDRLSIVGLAFEMTGDFERDAAQLRVYRDHHGIDWPLLVAGTSDKAEASRAFPLIERVKSFPTAIFLHEDGRVHSVYSGFSGPATGAAHEALRESFETTIEELLGEG